MSKSCCSGTESISMQKHLCPANGKPSKPVSTRTVLHHVKQPWNLSTEGNTYFFCDDPGCDVVYFDDSNSVINTSDLRDPVGIKEAKANSTVCYCYGISFAAAKSDTALKEFVTEQTKLGLCACETRNPSGKCCLKDFPKS